MDSDATTHTHPEIEELAKALLGPRRSKFEGGGRIEEKGLIHQTKQMEERQRSMEKRLENGLRLKIPVPIWVAIIGTFGLVLAEVIGRLIG